MQFIQPPTAVPRSWNLDSSQKTFPGPRDPGTPDAKRQGPWQRQHKSVIDELRPDNSRIASVAITHQTSPAPSLSNSAERSQDGCPGATYSA
ncbi:hypothetical protein V8C35DRAFT_123768 [Trichoderma chlorosporum]